MTDSAVERARELIAKLEDYYDFECEGGPLKNCQDWIALKTSLASLIEGRPNWQPIETAPEGVLILVWRERCQAWIAKLDCGRWLQPYSAIQLSYQPTHWQPIVPPVAEPCELNKAENWCLTHHCYPRSCGVVKQVLKTVRTAPAKSGDFDSSSRRGLADQFWEERKRTAPADSRTKKG